MTLYIGLNPQGGQVTAASHPPGPRRPLPVVVVRIDLPGGAAYVSDAPYLDVAAEILAEVRLAADVTLERSVSTVLWGGQTRIGIGAVELHNDDGALDHLILAPPAGAAIDVFFGHDDTPWAEMSHVATAVVDHVSAVGERRVRLVVLDARARLRQPLQSETYTSGALEGRLIPVLLGHGHSIPSVPADPPNLRYGTHDAAGLTTHAVRNRGAAMTVTTQWEAYSVGEIHGHRFLVGLGDGARVTVDATAPDWSTYDADSLPGIVGALVEGRLGWPAAEIDYAGLEALATELGDPTFGDWHDAHIEVDRVLDAVADSFVGWWYVDLDGVLRFDRLRVPAGEPAFVITETELVGEIEPEQDTMPGLSTRVEGVRNAHVHAESELAGSVRETAFGALLQREYRETTEFDVHPSFGRAVGADRPSRHTRYADAASVSAEAARRETLTKNPALWYRGAIELGVIEAAMLQPGTVVSAVVRDRVTGEPRYGLDGRLMVLTDLRLVAGRGRVEFRAWAPLEGI